MSDSEPAAPRKRLRERIELLEEAYEYFLSYAARGLRGDDGDRELREYLERSLDAVDAVPGLFRESAARVEEDGSGALAAFGRVLEEDAHKARAALDLVASRGAVSSQLVDNLNVSTHVRALLTDLFLVDEALEPDPGAAPAPDEESRP